MNNMTPQAIIHSGETPLPDDSHHYYGMKTTYSEDGAVQIASYQSIASAWALHSFLPDDCGYGDMSGVWVAFTSDTHFRAGEGVWLLPSNFIPRPKVKIES
ncbi:hypothetical protein E6W36_14290 [Hankyongella ginsenosidimutans]|uniref:Uncharacterized protein n=1 Tax=Hankyongella ginsenosidimutans TaxID=1763828 RepID=A0A4D7C573_9SPHN|nr:hypothetical protein [Hankyongella ginsenosidimutans]QCI80251.1 hypothetical protein E6W36_14290 [Hankyongella ginsenosidimutans]